jgi:hypothetical protein
MKKLSIIFLSLVLLAGPTVFIGCSSSKTAYRTVGITFNTADAAIHSWADFVKAGYATPEQEAVVKDAWTKYLAAKNLAKSVISTGTSGDQVTDALNAVSASNGEVIKIVQMFLSHK